MKKLILPVIVLNYCLVPFAQKKQTFLVEYFFEQKQILTTLTDSVKERKVPISVFYTSNGDTTKTDTVEGTIRDLVGSFNFAAAFYMLANQDMSKTFFKLGNNSNFESDRNIALTVNTPDTIFYFHKRWYKTNEDSMKKVDLVDISVVNTSETKDILGYKCVKFVSSGKDKDKKIIFWASKDLPATLIPYSGLKSFGYGILQIDDLKRGLFTKATRITKL